MGETKEDAKFLALRRKYMGDSANKVSRMLLLKDIGYRRKQDIIG